MIAKGDEPHGTGLGIFRYVVERTIAWLHDFRRLRIRWERRDDIRSPGTGRKVPEGPTGEAEPPPGSHMRSSGGGNGVDSEGNQMSRNVSIWAPTSLRRSARSS